jgi:hypothetical protein
VWWTIKGIFSRNVEPCPKLRRGDHRAPRFILVALRPDLEVTVVKLAWLGQDGGPGLKGAYTASICSIVRSRPV